jgi:choline kinase/phosphoglycolate phosphatase-like HAD superfamily hydrolase/phosphatidylglycerophosphate synthase
VVHKLSRVPNPVDLQGDRISARHTLEPGDLRSGGLPVDARKIPHIGIWAPRPRTRPCLAWTKFCDGAGAGVRPPPGRIARSEKHGRRGRLEITGRIGEALYAVPRTFYCSGAPLPLGGPVMKCLMLAGGAGSRLGARGGLKPLAAVAGLSLVERAIVTAHAAGADEFYLVCGHNCRKLVAHLEDVARRRSLVIHPVFNADYRKGNGLSVLCAREVLAAEPRFVLLMADHVFEPELLSGLFREDPGPDEVVLAVDRDLSNPLVELDDVTLVEASGGRVRAIGKGLDRYDGFDTGAFVCTPAVFEALEESVASGDTSLSGGMRLLAAADRLRARDVTGHMWIDVDTRGDQRRARNWLHAELRKPDDGFVSRRLNRPLSLGVLTPGLLHVWGGVTANQASVLAFLVGATAGAVFAVGWPLAAGLLVHLSSVLDGSDGEIARLKRLESGFGGYLDAVLDRFADSLMLLGVLVYLVESSSLRSVLGDSWPLGVVVPTVAAIIGTLMVSYTSTKAMADMGHRYLGPVVGAGRGRDLRLLILSVAALLAVVHPLFLLGGVVVIAVLTLLVVARRLVWSRAATWVGRSIDLGSVQAVVFDFDGTVADTMGVLSDAAVALLTETYGMSAETAWQAYRETTGMDFAAQLERIAPGGRCNAELADRFADRKPDLVRDCIPFPRTLDALARLRNLGVAVFICSSTTHEIVERFCAATGIDDLVDDVSGLRPEHTKLDQLQATVNRTGLRPDQVLFVGDSLYDVELANETGTRFTGATGLFTAEEFARAGVTTIVDLPELAALMAAAHARRQLLERPAREPTGLSGRRLRGATVAHTAAGQTSDTAVQYVRMTTTSAPARGDQTTLDGPPLEDRR